MSIMPLASTAKTSPVDGCSSAAIAWKDGTSRFQVVRLTFSCGAAAAGWPSKLSHAVTIPHLSGALAKGSLIESKQA